MNSYSSCLNCVNRHLGCHANCNVYIAYKANLLKIKLERDKYRAVYSDIHKYTR